MFEYLLAHLIGDWLLQPRKMAVEKGKQTFLGWNYCIAHVMIYTGCFVILVPDKSFLFYLSIFIPHFIIDKFSLVSYWQRLKDGAFWYDSYRGEPELHSLTTNRFMARVEMGLAGLRYAVEDNTVHLICLWLSKVYLA